MTFDLDNNNSATACADEGMYLGAFNVPTKISSVTAATDKEAEKAAKKAEREAKKSAADAVKAAEKAAKATARAEAKAAKEAEDAALKAAKDAEDAAAWRAAVGVIAEAEVLANEEASFEKLKASNEAVQDGKRYSLLTKIHALGEKVLADPAADKIIKAMRRELDNKYNIKTQANSPALNVITRFVTRTNRKNACVYARVISVAISKGIRSEDLEQFIVDAHGMHKIRPDLTAEKEKKENSAKKQKRMFDSWSRYAMNKLYDKASTGNVLGELTLTVDNKNDIADGRGRAEFVHMFGCYQDGKFVVIDFAPYVSEEQEFEMLSEYAYFEVYRAQSGLGSDKAVEVFNSKVKHLFDMYNAAWEAKGYKHSVNRFGEVVTHGQSQIKQFNTPFAELEDIYAQQVSAVSPTAQQS